jgi:hypothetical protein
MGNAYPASSNHGQRSGSSVHDDADNGWDEEADTERAALREENARLRALVVQLSTLVLRNVVDQNSQPQLMPVRPPRFD